MRKAIFITLEGPDGCGKSTQIAFLVRALKSTGRRVTQTREPGGTRLAEGVRALLLNPRLNVSPLAELMLYEAARAQHTDEIIRPALRAGKVVVSDRYFDATVAYQGYGRGLDLDMIARLNSAATGGLKPNLTLVLDLPVQEGLKRARRSKGSRDRMEREKIAFYERVRKGYLALARRDPRRVKVVSALGTVDQVRDRIWKIVSAKVGIK